MKLVVYLAVSMMIRDFALGRRAASLAIILDVAISCGRVEKCKDYGRARYLHSCRKVFRKDRSG